MKSNDQKSAAAQAQPTENRESFMTLLRDSLRATVEQMLQEGGYGRGLPFGVWS